MSTYDGDPTTYPALITLPDDGDDYDVASVNAPLGGLADRAAALSHGRAVADATALKALTGMVDGVLRFVQGNGGASAQGFYRFRSGGIVIGESAPWVYEADDASGEWIWSSYEILGNLRANRILYRYGIGRGADPPSAVAFDSVTGTAWAALSYSGTPVSVGVVSMSTVVIAGDIVVAHAHVSATSDTSAEGYLGLRLTLDATPTIITGSAVAVPTHVAQRQHYTLVGHHTIAAPFASALSVALVARTATAGGTIYAFEGVSLALEVIRP
jgi:hypothetical protein